MYFFGYQTVIDINSNLKVTLTSSDPEQLFKGNRFEIIFINSFEIRGFHAVIFI